MLIMPAILCLLVGALASGRGFRWVLGFGVVVFVLGCLGMAWAFLMPQDFIARHPMVQNTILHPWSSMFYGLICLASGGSVLVGVAARRFCRWFTRAAPSSPNAS